MSATDYKSATIGAYRRNAALFETRGSCSTPHRISPLLKATIARLDPGAAVLDLGCGTGHDALLFTRRGFRVTGIDATPEFIDAARARCPRGKFVLADMTSFRAQPGSFDVVWANASLIHLPKAELPVILRRIRKWLKPNGVFAATFHNGKGEGIRDRTWIPGRFFASYLREELEHLLISAGLGIELLTGVVNEDRKGRWLTALARRGKSTPPA